MTIISFSTATCFGYV